MWAAEEEEQALAICACICVSKIGIYVNAGKDSALRVLVCMRSNVGIEYMCVCISLLARPEDGKRSGCAHQTGSETTPGLALAS